MREDDAILAVERPGQMAGQLNVVDLILSYWNIRCPACTETQCTKHAGAQNMQAHIHECTHARTHNTHKLNLFDFNVVPVTSGVSQCKL